jgi:NADH:ubiquinone oxidoreductase subunit 3 (subunit A)
MRLLTDDEQKQFREEYQQKETEVQKNIAVYLSALVVATGWIFGPQAKPVLQMFLGNDGMNIFGVLILIAINVVFTCFLTYKSIEIHEIMQFVTYLSPLETGLQYWESWRRSKQSLTKKWFTRQHYIVAIILVPFWVSVLLLAVTHYWIWAAPRTLAKEIHKVQESAKTSQSNTQAQETPSMASERSTEPSQEFVDRLSGTLHSAKVWWYIVTVFHYFPLLFFAVSWRVGGKKWKEIKNLQPSKPTFDKLEPPNDDDAGGQASE